MRKLRTMLLAWLLVAAVVLPLAAASPAEQELYASKHGVFYQIFVRSFADGDGDGLGDLRGIIERLDYLNDGDPQTTSDLGVTGIWLTPIHPSPTYHKYDVVDYYAIDPEIGTLADFQELIDQAQARGMKVILDLVCNHTSSQHPWFLAASSDPESPYRDYYIWYDPVLAAGPLLRLFLAKCRSNWANPKVREVKAVAAFWLSRGGRLPPDAATPLERPQPESGDWWLEFSDFLGPLARCLPGGRSVDPMWWPLLRPSIQPSTCLADRIIPIVRFGLDTGWSRPAAAAAVGAAGAGRCPF